MPRSCRSVWVVLGFGLVALAVVACAPAGPIAATTEPEPTATPSSEPPTITPPPTDTPEPTSTPTATPTNTPKPSPVPTITETVSEEEFNEALDAEGFVADFQPGKIVLTGSVEGMAVVMEMTVEEVEGGVTTQITNVTVDGQPMDPALFADTNEELSQSIFNDPDYAVDSVVITDTDMTVTASRR
jgi:glucose/arabinose dehydrogenase